MFANYNLIRGNATFPPFDDGKGDLPPNLDLFAQVHSGTTLRSTSTHHTTHDGHRHGDDVPSPWR